MQRQSHSISPAELFARLGTASAPKIIDVRRPDDFDKSDVLIASAFHREPDEVERWQKDLGKEDMVVVHCVHGRQVSTPLNHYSWCRWMSDLVGAPPLRRSATASSLGTAFHL